MPMPCPFHPARAVAEPDAEKCFQCMKPATLHFCSDSCARKGNASPFAVRAVAAPDRLVAEKAPAPRPATHLLGTLEAKALKIDEWLQQMRGDALIGRDIQDLQSYKPTSLERIVIVAVLSFNERLIPGLEKKSENAHQVVEACFTACNDAINSALVDCGDWEQAVKLGLAAIKDQMDGPAEKAPMPPITAEQLQDIYYDCLQIEGGVSQAMLHVNFGMMAAAINKLAAEKAAPAAPPRQSFCPLCGCDFCRLAQQGASRASGRGRAGSCKRRCNYGE
jgi:hypothetical protein